MEPSNHEALFKEFSSGRTGLIFKLLDLGLLPGHQDPPGISLLRHCAYYGDVSAMKFLLSLLGDPQT
jgi:hypothetical protein